MASGDFGMDFYRHDPAAGRLIKLDPSTDDNYFEINVIFQQDGSIALI